MNFKAQVERDIKTVFHNSDEHADVVVFHYDGKRYKAPVIMDYTGAVERTKRFNDYGQGIFLVDVVMYVSFEDIKVIPRKDRTIEIGDDVFTIKKVEHEAGEIVLHLEMYDE